MPHGVKVHEKLFDTPLVDRLTVPRVAAAILRLLRLRLRSEVKLQIFWKNPTK